MPDCNFVGNLFSFSAVHISLGLKRFVWKTILHIIVLSYHQVYHECAWGSRGQFVPTRYNSSRAKCIKCHYCGVFFSPNKFVFHSHRLTDSDKYIQPDAANFNSWRRHTKLLGDPPEVSPNHQSFIAKIWTQFSEPFQSFCQFTFLCPFFICAT